MTIDHLHTYVDSLSKEGLRRQRTMRTSYPAFPSPFPIYSIEHRCFLGTPYPRARRTDRQDGRTAWHGMSNTNIYTRRWTLDAGPGHWTQLSPAADFKNPVRVLSSVGLEFSRIMTRVLCIYASQEKGSNTAHPENKATRLTCTYTLA